MLVQETTLNATENYIFCKGELYEPFTDEIGKLFLAFQKQFGKCMSKIYIDSINGTDSRPIGWVFQKIEKYTDTHDPYLQETWVTLHDGEPEITTKYNYHYL